MLTSFKSTISLIPASYFFFGSIKELQSKLDLPKIPSSYLLQFHATWCSPCKQLTPILMQVFNEKTERSFDIYRVDIDKVRDLSKQYDVAAIPMLVGVVNGNIVAEEVGLSEKHDIKRLFEIIEKETKKVKEVAK